MLAANKPELINIPTIQIDKNVIKYANSFICTDNISLITISQIPANKSWIGAIILAIVSIAIIKAHFVGVLFLIVAIVWFIAVVHSNNNRGENLAIALNAGITLYFNCKDRAFLNKVVSTMIDSIKSKNQHSYSINFEKCTIHGGVLNESVVSGS